MLQQRLCTIVEINDDDSLTTNSSCFTSPSIDTPPSIRRLQSLTLTPRNMYNLWSSSIDSNLLLNQTTLNSSDSGRDSADSSFSSENESSPPIKRYITRPVTIYQLEKAKERESARSSSKRDQKTRFTFTSSTKVFIGEDDNQIKESEPSTTVLKIYIPPNVEKNVAERIAKHKQSEPSNPKAYQMDISSPKVGEHQRRIVVSTKYGNPNASSRDYRVVAWENNGDKTAHIGRIENFMPEVDRRQNDEALNSAKRNSPPSIFASSSLPSVAVEVESEKLKVEGGAADNTLSDISSYSSNISEKELSNTESTKSTSSSKSLDSTKPSEGNKFESKIRSSTPPSNDLSRIDSCASVKIREMTDSMLKDRIVEVGVQPWKSQSVKHFTNKLPSGPRLVEEKTKKRVIFPDNSTTDNQHVYENIDDCREQCVEHPRKILPIPGKRLPFRQPPRVPVLSVHQPQFYGAEEQRDIAPDISFVSYKFYDRNMCEQNSLSQRCSAQLLRKSAIRLSLPRSKSKPSYSTSVRRQEPFSALPSNATKSVPLRYQLNDQINSTKSRDDNSIVTVNGKQTCANCHLQLGRGQAMTIDSLGLFYHLHCFKCSQCGVLLNSGDSNGMDVRVNGTRIQCNQCYNFGEETGTHYSQI